MYQSTLDNACNESSYYEHRTVTVLIDINVRKIRIVMYRLQWRIQDFPGGGGASTPRGMPTYYLTFFSRKLHENEEIFTQRGAKLITMAYNKQIEVLAASGPSVPQTLNVDEFLCIGIWCCNVHKLSQLHSLKYFHRRNAASSTR